MMMMSQLPGYLDQYKFYIDLTCNCEVVPIMITLSHKYYA